MNSASKYAVILLLAISITGCTEKKAKTTPPPQAQAPSIEAGKAGAMYPPPLTSSQPQTEQPPPAPAPEVATTVPPPAPPPPPEKTKKAANSAHKSKPSATKSEAADNSSSTAGQAPASSGTSSASTESSSNEVAANAELPAASPIGELSTGDVSEQTRKVTTDLISNTENGLNSIKRALSVQEQETANQIKTFLTQARTALKNDDLDGAHTLATKAKVLLDELNKT